MIDPIALLDLTSLNESDTLEVARDLCGRAETPRGPVAAVCVMPHLVSASAQLLAGSPVRVATVADFPGGDGGVSVAVMQTETAIAAGADEVDVVVPWREHLEGDPEAVGRTVAACVEACQGRPLKAILETGSHPDPGATRAMAHAALVSGARFVKTSTGKVGPGATLDAVRVLLEVVREEGGGVKVSGGVRTRADAEAYISLAEEIMGPGWATPLTFRFGASTLLDELLSDA